MATTRTMARSVRTSKKTIVVATCNVPVELNRDPRRQPPG
jgi:hypothetical protein